jgi:hypothetical protein
MTSKQAADVTVNAAMKEWDIVNKKPSGDLTMGGEPWLALNGLRDDASDNHSM